MIGATLFGWLSYALKTAHSFASPLFAVSLLVVIPHLRARQPADRRRRRVGVQGGGLLSDTRSPRTATTAPKVLFWVGVFWVG